MVIASSSANLPGRPCQISTSESIAMVRNTITRERSGTVVKTDLVLGCIFVLVLVVGYAGTGLAAEDAAKADIVPIDFADTSLTNPSVVFNLHPEAVK